MSSTSVTVAARSMAARTSSVSLPCAPIGSCTSCFRWARLRSAVSFSSNVRRTLSSGTARPPLRYRAMKGMVFPSSISCTVFPTCSAVVQLLCQCLYDIHLLSLRFSSREEKGNAAQCGIAGKPGEMERTGARPVLRKHQSKYDSPLGRPPRLGKVALLIVAVVATDGSLPASDPKS